MEIIGNSIVAVRPIDAELSSTSDNAISNKTVNTAIANVRNEIGSPLVANTAAQMTNTNKIYVYVGSESGYVNGNWYYHNGTRWVSGGVYNSQGFETDKTLLISDAPADAKTVGDKLNEVNQTILDTKDEIEDDIDEVKDEVGVLEWYDSGLWVEGHLNSGSGVISTNPTYNRMCTPELIPANVTCIKVHDGYRIIPYCWSADGSTYIGIWNGNEPAKVWSENNWITGTVDLKAISTEYRFKLLAQQVSNQRQLVPATDADKFVFTSFTDETFTIGGKAADAKKTGDVLSALTDYDVADGYTVHFKNGAKNMPIKSMVATIEPVQNLHGYDSPWIGGAGKNMLPMTVEGIKAANPNATWNDNSATIYGVTYTILTDDDGNVTGINCNGTASPTSVFWLGSIQLANGDCVKVEPNTATNSDVFFRISGPGKGVYDINFNNGVYVATSDAEVWGNIRVGSGTTVSNKVFYPIVCKESEEDSSFAPYSNICSIGGRTGIIGKRRGKNLAFFSNGSRTNTGVTAVYTDGVITTSGTATDLVLTGTTDLYLNAGTYRIFNFAPQSNGVLVTVQQSEGTTSWPSLAATASFTDTFTLTRRTKVAVRIKIPNGVNANGMVFRPMLVEGTDVPEEFEPCINQDINVTWQSQAGSVYGGKEDVISGEMEVDVDNFILDGSTLISTVAELTNVIRFWAATDSKFYLPGANNIGKHKCDRLTYNGGYEADVPSYSFATSYPTSVVVKLPIGTCEPTVNAIKAYLAANPIQFVFPLASTAKYNLAPQEVTTLQGDNIVYADVGPVSVTYPSDIGLKFDNTKSAISVLEDVINDKSSAIVGEDSGDVVLFTDGADNMPMKAMVATIEPVQDLHGYDYPMPAGYGKNLLDISKCAASGNNATITINGNEFTLTCNSSVWGSTNMSVESRINFKSGVTYTISAYGTVLTRDSNYSSPRITIRNESNTIVNAANFPSTNNTEQRISFTLTPSEDFVGYFSAVITGSQAGTASVKVRKPMVEIGSAVTDYEPYKNVCPISGHTGLVGKRTGKNLLQSLSPSTFTHNGVTFKIASDGSITANGQNNGTASYVSIPFNSNNMKPGNYYFSSGLNDGISNIKDVFIWDQTTNSRAKQWDGITNVVSSVRDQFYQLQILEGHNYVYDLRVTNGITVTDLKCYPMICPVDTPDTTWEAYTSKDIAMTWQSEVGVIYGGTVNIISGKLVANRVTHTLTGCEKFLELSTGTHRFGIFINNSGSSNSLGWEQCIDLTSEGVTNNAVGLMTSHFKYKSTSSVFGAVYIGTDKSLLFWDKDTKFDSLNAFKTWLTEQYNNGEPVQISYLIANPIEYQLTGQQIETLLGNNTIWTDVGQVSVTAPRDTKMYVDNKIAEVVAAALNA